MNDQEKKVLRYYRKRESRIGYRWLLSGVRHFGWYPTDGSLSRWKFAEAQRNMEVVLGRRLHAEPGMQVLDAGCGEGHVARTISEEFGCSVIGIDLLPESIEIANSLSRESGSVRTSFQVGSYQALPFENESFDRAYTMETLVHSSDVRGALNEFWRVLRPGGVLGMVEYSSTPSGDLSADSYAALREVAELGAMPAWLELEHGKLENYAIAAGFDVKSTEDLTANMLPMLSAFRTIAAAPYWALTRLGKQRRAVNAMSAVEMMKHADSWRYSLYLFRKPE